MEDVGRERDEWREVRIGVGEGDVKAEYGRGVGSCMMQCQQILQWFEAEIDSVKRATGLHSNLCGRR